MENFIFYIVKIVDIPIPIELKSYFAHEIQENSFAFLKFFYLLTENTIQFLMFILFCINYKGRNVDVK